MIIHQPSLRRQVFSYRTPYGLFVTLLSVAMCVAWPYGFSSFTNPAPIGLGIGVGAGLFLLTCLCFLNWRNARITIDGSHVTAYNLFGRVSKRAPTESIRGIQYVYRYNFSILLANGSIGLTQFISDFQELRKLIEEISNDNLQSGLIHFVPETTSARRTRLAAIATLLAAIAAALAGLIWYSLSDKSSSGPAPLPFALLLILAAVLVQVSYVLFGRSRVGK